MKVSELFYSTQQEGYTTGTPAVFIRLQGCNLLCGYNDFTHGDPDSIPTWICDTIDVWRKGIDHTNEEVWQMIKKRGEEVNVPNLQEWVLNGTVHIVWTGGEPMLKRNIQDIEGFKKWLDSKYITIDGLTFFRWEDEWNLTKTRNSQDRVAVFSTCDKRYVLFNISRSWQSNKSEIEKLVENLADNKAGFSLNGEGYRYADDEVEFSLVYLPSPNEQAPRSKVVKVFHEVETNGTIVTINDNAYLLFDQINCSPKLRNSGMAAKARVVPEAINQIKEHSNHWWKFVLDCTTEQTALQDIDEIDKDFVQPFNLDKRRIIIMPGVDRREDLADRTRVLFETAKKTGVRAVTRGHVLAYNQVTGV